MYNSPSLTVPTTAITVTRATKMEQLEKRKERRYALGDVIVIIVGWLTLRYSSKAWRENFVSREITFIWRNVELDELDTTRCNKQLILMLPTHMLSSYTNELFDSRELAH